MLGKSEHAVEKRKVRKVTDFFLFMLKLIHTNCSLYYLCLLGDLPVLVSEDIVISQPAKILNFLRKQVSLFQKDLFSLACSDSGMSPLYTDTGFQKPGI